MKTDNNNNNNIPTVKCDKCKQQVPTNEIRVYHLTLRPTNLKNPIDKITLCKSCDALRRTTVTKYVSL